MSAVTPADFPSQYGNLALGLPGMPAGELKVESRRLASSAGIGFGVPVWIDEGNDRDAFATKAEATKPHLRGIVRRTQSATNAITGQGQLLAQKEALNVIYAGKTLVTVKAAVVSGTQAYLDSTGTQFTNSAESGAIATPWIYRSTTALGGIAVIEVIDAPAALAV